MFRRGEQIPRRGDIVLHHAISGETALTVLAAGTPIDFVETANRVDHLVRAPTEEAGDAMPYQLGHGCPAHRDYGSAACEGFWDYDPE